MEVADTGLEVCVEFLAVDVVHVPHETHLGGFFAMAGTRLVVFCIVVFEASQCWFSNPSEISLETLFAVNVRKFNLAIVVLSIW